MHSTKIPLKLKMYSVLNEMLFIFLIAHFYGTLFHTYRIMLQVLSRIRIVPGVAYLACIHELFTLAIYRLPTIDLTSDSEIAGSFLALMKNSI